MSTQTEKGAVTPSEEVWDPWRGKPPANERLKNAFNPLRNNPKAREVIDKLLGFGRRLNDPSLGEAQPSREDFERLVDELTTKPEGTFLSEDHPTLGGNNLAVIRWAVDGAVGGKPVEYRELHGVV
mgnify:CR=1 FL=1